MDEKNKPIEFTNEHKRMARRITLYHEQMLVAKLMEIGSGSQKPEDLIDADLKAMGIYLQMGYDKSEAFSTFCSVFKNGKANKKRFDIIKKYIDEFNKQIK